MRKVVVSEFLTLDGIMEAPDKWQLKYVNEEMGNDVEKEICSADSLLFGRTTYLTMAGAWPTRTGTVADKFNPLPKHVVSTTLEKAEWNNSKIIKSNFIEEITKLDGRILVWGSWKLVQTLIQNNLVDEYRLYVHSFIQGQGKRLFEEGTHTQDLKLIETKILGTGVVVLNYRSIN